MANVHQQALLNNIAALMDDTKYNDLVIECDGKQWHVHKAIICSASPVLASECNGPMIESLAGLIKHTEFDTETVGRMISYIYKQTYEVAGEDGIISSVNGDGTAAAGVNHVLIVHVQVYGIGDFYRIDSLKTFATERFRSTAKHGFEIDSFIEVIKAVNERTRQGDRALRDVLRDYAIEHYEEIAKHTVLMSELAEHPDLQDFAAAMFRQMVRQQIKDKEEFSLALKTKDLEIIAKDQTIRTLEREKEQAQSYGEYQLEVSRDRCTHIESVMDNLIEGLEDLPESCRNANCDKEFSGLKFERKGHARYYREGDWVVRCARCRCRLIS